MKNIIITIFIALLCFSLLSTGTYASMVDTSNNSGLSMYDKFLSWQLAANNALNTHIRSLKMDFNWLDYLKLLFISIGLGILHSAGPGHGKALVAAYFLKNKNNIIQTSNLAFIISFIHTGSAILMAVLFNSILSSFKGIARIKAQEYFTFVSGILILLVGLWFLFSKMRGKDLGDIREDVDMNRQLWLVGVSAGIIPCPLALMIILISISANIVWIGITSVFGISFGMYLLLSLVGVLSVHSRAGLLNKLERNRGMVKYFSEGLCYLSVIAIIIIGVWISLFSCPFK